MPPVHVVGCKIDQGYPEALQPPKQKKASTTMTTSTSSSSHSVDHSEAAGRGAEPACQRLEYSLPQGAPLSFYVERELNVRCRQVVEEEIVSPAEVWDRVTHLRSSCGFGLEAGEAPTPHHDALLRQSRIPPQEWDHPVRAEAERRGFQYKASLTTLVLHHEPDIPCSLAHCCCAGVQCQNRAWSKRSLGKCGN